MGSIDVFSGCVPSVMPEFSPEFPSEAVSAFPVRRLRIDLSKGFDPLWNGGDAFRTHHLNALSMSFPIGEQFFIDAVRAGVAMLPEAERPAWAARVKGFVGQEATHRYVHAQYNAELARQGLRNRWEGWAARRIARARELHPVNHVAVTAALEHITAVLATGVLTRAGWLAGADPRMTLLWRWHAVEESEHKAVAFDLYRAMGGSELRRRLWFIHSAGLFVIESTLQTWLNLWRAGCAGQPRTWWQGLKFMLGPGGVWPSIAGPLARYLRSGFHPAQVPDAPGLADWLREHASTYSIVASTAAP
ncbi:MAG TPA: metal-dependent hydrolase [Burkholderiaceae bacterium]|nr:metal-dependent hydrolase [Burkholderiaceae bacterium]